MMTLLSPVVVGAVRIGGKNRAVAAAVGRSTACCWRFRSCSSGGVGGGAPSAAATFSTASNPKKKPPKSSSSTLWQVATFAVVGTTFVVAGNYFSSPSWRYDEDAAKDGADRPVKPQAEVTSRAYLDVEIGGQPAGRIIIGLHGNVVPKTTGNFESICRGGQKIGNIDMTYEGSIFHRIIPSFMIQGGEKPGRSIYKSVHYDGRFNDEVCTCGVNVVARHVHLNNKGGKMDF